MRFVTYGTHFMRNVTTNNVMCLLLISTLWHRQAIFEWKGNTLTSSRSAECRIGTQGLRHQIASRQNAYWQTDWTIEDQATNLNSIARPHDQRAFSHSTQVWCTWLTSNAIALIETIYRKRYSSLFDGFYAIFFKSFTELEQTCIFVTRNECYSLGK